MSTNEINSELPNVNTLTVPPGAKLFAEDGWIFSQAPGKGVECLRRIDDSSLMSQPNLVRHNYPST